MPIVSQFASVSYSLFPPYPLLNAPPPRLLLPAPKHTAPITITYTHALLNDLDEIRRQHLIDAMTTMLDVSVGYLLDLLNLDAFRAGQVAFHREITGKNPPRPHTPEAYNAERDGDILDWFMNAPRRMEESRQQAERDLDAVLQALRERQS